MVAPSMPSPGGNGLSMRLSLFLEALQRIAQTDLLLVPVLGDIEALTVGKSPIIRARLQPDTELSLLLQLRDPELKLASFVRYGKTTFAGLFSNAAWATLARQISTEPYDLVHVARSYLIPGLTHFRGRAATTLDLDEDDLASFTSLARLERNQRRIVRAGWQEQQGRASDRMVGDLNGAVDAAFAASKIEALNLSRRHDPLTVECIPNAIALRQRRREPRLDTLLFVGTLNYLPNNEGLLWFLDYVLPRVRRHRHCRVVIIGRGPLPELRAAVRRRGVRLLDRVDNLEPHYRSASAVIAPMRSGGGTRIKLLEAASYGVPSIATPAAAAGLYARERPWGWVAEGPQQFADACLAALCDAKQGAARAARGRSEVSRYFSRAKVISHLAQRFTQLVKAGQEVHGREK